MKTDPRKACANAEEKLFWALLHDGIAHPLMALTLYSRSSLVLHDATSRRAWPRPKAIDPRPYWQKTKYGWMKITEIAPGIYSIPHFKVSHTFVTNAASPIEAAEKAEDAFDALAEQHGGEFIYQDTEIGEEQVNPLR
jgi:hypothetical protein